MRSSEVLSTMEGVYSGVQLMEKRRNIKKVVAKFEGRMNTEVRQQEKLDRAEEKL